MMKLKAKRRFFALSRIVNIGDVFQVENEKVYHALLARRVAVETDEPENAPVLAVKKKSNLPQRDKSFSLATPAHVMDNFLAATDSLPGDEVPPGLPERLFLSPVVPVSTVDSTEKPENTEPETAPKKRGRHKKVKPETEPKQHADILEDRAAQASKPRKNGKRK